MEIINFKDFTQVAGIMQMAGDTEAPAALRDQYSIYLNMTYDEREVFMGKLLKCIKPQVAKLYYLIKQMEL